MDKSPDIIIEMIHQGKFVKVTAIDVATGREVSMVGAGSASQNDLHALAINKLKYVMNKEKEKSDLASKANKKRGLDA